MSDRLLDAAAGLTVIGGLLGAMLGFVVSVPLLVVATWMEGGA